MALLKDMQETSVIYIGQYKKFHTLGNTIRMGDTSYSTAIQRLCTVFLLDNYVEVIIEEDDPGSNLSGVHKSIQVTRDSYEMTNDLRFTINQCFND